MSSSATSVSHKEIDEDMVGILGPHSCSHPHTYNIVNQLNAELRRGRLSLEDDPRRRAVSVSTLETIANMHVVMSSD